jgi:hypothetical protein
VYECPEDLYFKAAQKKNGEKFGDLGGHTSSEIIQLPKNFPQKAHGFIRCMVCGSILLRLEIAFTLLKE